MKTFVALLCLGATYGQYAPVGSYGLDSFGSNMANMGNMGTMGTMVGTTMGTMANMGTMGTMVGTVGTMGAYGTVATPYAGWNTGVTSPVTMPYGAYNVLGNGWNNYGTPVLNNFNNFNNLNSLNGVNWGGNVAFGNTMNWGMNGNVALRNTNVGIVNYGTPNWGYGTTNLGIGNRGYGNVVNPIAVNYGNVGYGYANTGVGPWNDFGGVGNWWGGNMGTRAPNGVGIAPSPYSPNGWNMNSYMNSYNNGYNNGWNGYGTVTAAPVFTRATGIATPYAPTPYLNYDYNNMYGNLLTAFNSYGYGNELYTWSGSANSVLARNTAYSTPVWNNNNYNGVGNGYNFGLATPYSSWTPSTSFVDNNLYGRAFIG